MDPALLMVGAGRSVGQAAMGHAQQRSTRLMIDQVDLDQTRPRWYVFAVVPPEAIGEAVDRNDLGELAAGDVLAGDVDEVKAAGMRLHRRLRAHPPQDLFRIGEESEHGRGRRRYLGFASDHARFNHRKPPSTRAWRDARSGSACLKRASTLRRQDAATGRTGDGAEQGSVLDKSTFLATSLLG